jgi:formamidopyrimidine-DNA glycosylase
MALIDTATLSEHSWFAGLGPEPLSDAFDAQRLVDTFAGRKQGPKTLLLDQRVVAGLGNIYVCEALNRARISPFKPAGTLKPAQIKPLVGIIRDVLDEAIEAGGSTLRDYAAADGALGYFQHRFRAYGREGELCLNDGCNGVIHREVQAGRSTFFCSICQK